MLKLTLAASAIAVVGATAYYLHSSAPTKTVAAAKPLLHYGTGPARPPALGPTSPHHLTAARQTAVGDLGMLPADSDLVFGIDMARIQQSALWQMFVAPQVSKASGLQDFATACGFDPLASLTSMSIGLKGLGNDGNVVGTFVVHGFDKTKVMACLQQNATKLDEHAHITIDGDVVFLVPSEGHGPPLGLTFIDNTTALAMFSSTPVTKADVEKAAANNSGLQASPTFAELFANINSDDPLWLVIAPSSPLFPLMNSEIAEHANHQLHALYGSIDITSSIVVEAGLRLGSTEQVAQVVSEVQQKIDKLAAGGALAQYFDQLDINADGGDVIFSLAANAGQLVNIAKSHDVHADATPATPNGPGTFSVSANVPID